MVLCTLEEDESAGESDRIARVIGTHLSEILVIQSESYSHGRFDPLLARRILKQRSDWFFSLSLRLMLTVTATCMRKLQSPQRTGRSILHRALFR